MSNGKETLKAEVSALKKEIGLLKSMNLKLSKTLFKVKTHVEAMKSNQDKIEDTLEICWKDLTESEV